MSNAISEQDPIDLFKLQERLSVVESELADIRNRNRPVESDKAWETMPWSALIHHRDYLRDHGLSVPSAWLQSPVCGRAGTNNGIFSLHFVDLVSSSSFKEVRAAVILKSDPSLGRHLRRFAHELSDCVENDLELRIIPLFKMI